MGAAPETPPSGGPAGASQHLVLEDLRWPCEFTLYIALTYSREKIFLVEPTTKTERHGATTC